MSLDVEEAAGIGTCPIEGNRLKVGLINGHLQDLDGETVYYVILTKRGATALLKDIADFLADCEGVQPPEMKRE